MKVYEVFLKKAGKDEFRHAGSLEAPDADLALMYGRESYARRGEGAEMWVVERRHIVVADPTRLAVNDDKPHRHNDGSTVAERRKRQREAARDTTTAATTAAST